MVVNLIVVAVNSIELVAAVAAAAAAAGSSIGMQSSAVHGRAVARNSAYCEAPTLRSNATTSRLFWLMAKLRGVSRHCRQAGEWEA